MNRIALLFRRVCTILLLIVSFHQATFADTDITSHFEYDFEGVKYKVNVNKREAYAWGLAETNPATAVKIKSFSLKGSKIKEITGSSVFTDGTTSENIDLSATYTFKPVIICQGFQGTNITSVQMENTVTSIWSAAFKNCSNLKTVTLSSGLTEIVIQTFKNCPSLTTIQIPASVTTIGKSAFSGCGLTSVTFGSGSALKFIDSNAFSGCEQLKNITFPNQLETIEPSAFNGCTSLLSVSFPSQLKTIGESAFYGCTSLKTVTLPSQLTTLEASAFNSCTSLTSVTLNSTLKRIESSTFSQCSSLTEVKFEENCQITYIDEWAFAYCSSLKTFEMPDKVSDLSEWAFYETPIETLKISAAITRLTADHLPSSESLKTVTFGNNSKLKVIESSAFYDYKKLESISFPNSLTTIEESAFSGCTALSSVILPPNVKTIGYDAFGGCSNLKHLEIPTSVTTMDDLCFYNCGLQDIYVYWTNNILTGNGNIFNGGGTYGSAVLHVPVGMISAYRAVSPWNKFTNIVELQAGDPGFIIEINTTNFPDAKFREYVSGTSIDADGNGLLSDEEIAAVTTIDVNNLVISNMKGLEFFTALKTLNCRYTNIISLDLSKNIELEDLDCRNNNLTSLNVMNNTALTSLKCSRNKITSLNLSKNTQLVLLRCNYNQLTELNVSNNTKLNRFDCYGNKIGKSKMGNLVASLPTISGRLYVIDTNLSDEENVCTTDQVAVARAKGWIVYDYNNGSAVEYSGSSEQEPGDLNGDSEVNGTDLVMQTTLILAGEYNAVADLNNDQLVNGTDYVLLVNKILGVSSAPRLLAPASDVNATVDGKIISKK